MPELAEVEYYRKKWDVGLQQCVTHLHLNATKRLFRQGNPAELRLHLPQTVLNGSQASGKWMLFFFTSQAWLGIHLGMSGALSSGPSNYKPKIHDHLVLYQEKGSLIFSDPRLFGRVLFHRGKEAPFWWQNLPPSLLSTEVNLTDVMTFLKKHGRSPIKAVLLMQQRFPGIGNWMADEILWRSEIHPSRPAGSLTKEEQKELWKQTVKVAKDALRVIGDNWSNPPNTWLFNHRWKNNGICPKSGVPLIRETIGGRTTCWSPGRQKLGTLF
jgi:formamidopyrimidine-DNA glycosylase